MAIVISFLSDNLSRDSAAGVCHISKNKKALVLKNAREQKGSDGSLAVFYVEQVTLNRHALI